jgi:hypothetical protein
LPYVVETTLCEWAYSSAQSQLPSFVVSNEPLTPVLAIQYVDTVSIVLV